MSTPLAISRRVESEGSFMEDYRDRRSPDTSTYRRPRSESPDLEPYGASGSSSNGSPVNRYGSSSANGAYGYGDRSGSNDDMRTTGGMGSATGGVNDCYANGYEIGYADGESDGYGNDYPTGDDAGSGNDSRPFARTTRPRLVLAQNSSRSSVRPSTRSSVRPETRSSAHLETRSATRPEVRPEARQVQSHSKVATSALTQTSSNDSDAQSGQGTSRPRSHSSQSHAPAARMARLKPWLRLAALVLGVAGIVAIVILAVALSKANYTVADLQRQNSILDARNAFLESKNVQDTSTSSTSGSTASTPASTVSTSTSTTTTAVATGVEDPWVASGTFTTGNAELDADVKTFCDYLSDSSASATDNAYTVYLHVSWYDYVERDDNQNPQGPDWAITYALQLYNENGGNCYEFVAFCAFCLQYFGIDAVAQPCFIEHEAGDWGDHGLVLVTMDGTSYICDLSKSSKGWMLPGDYYTYQIQDIGQGNI